ncbi:protein MICRORCHIDIA 2-like isoform X1 [Canna indica]|uniref:Protein MICRORCHIDIA 2-like isoform X1 n=1 Tax=Canna indica TaxID=4628 RepID=A0AAQ3KBU7_9LILI|nr:protein MICRORCHIDIA 2-like isoform X1 [Canna indica]
MAMKVLKNFSSLCLLSLILFFNVPQATFVTSLQHRAYIVHMQLPESASLDQESFYRSFLSSVTSEQHMMYAYKNVFSDFAAKLTELELTTICPGDISHLLMSPGHQRSLVRPRYDAAADVGDDVEEEVYGTKSDSLAAIPNTSFRFAFNLTSLPMTTSTSADDDEVVVLVSPPDGGVNQERPSALLVVDELQQRPRTLECRNFWKAGACEVSSGPSSRAQHASLESSDFDRARVHPKFLHTNATSHKWAFGAIAELLDNAVDEIQNGATFVKVDKINNLKDNSPMLVFQDNGGGMDPEGIRRCMSLGFSSKRSKTTIGQYGNGFKTSTMRLGADAIVFSCTNRGSHMTLSIGLLSYTFLRRAMKDDIIVPMLDFQVQNGQIIPLILSSQDEWDSSLKTILDWSPFSSKEELLQQFEDMGLHGTKVFVYNLWMNDDGLLELDFDDDDEDILLRDQAFSEHSSKSDKVLHSHVSHKLKHSLRAYASVLYLRKFSNFLIILRGKPVEQVNIVDELKFMKTVTYKPQVGVDAEDVSVRITVGFAEAPVLGIFGVNVYHKNRLIMV